MKVRQYEVEGPIDLRLAFLADLHEKNPDAVIASLREIKPDGILVGGDVLERHDLGKDPKFEQTLSQLNARKRKSKEIKKDIYLFVKHILGSNKPAHENAYRFFQEASEIAPVFLSRGNHEWYYASEDLEVFERYGITLLDNSFVNWRGIRLGGLSPKFDWDFLENFEAGEGYKLLMCHHPEYYSLLLKNRRIDLVLAGHAHGGQIRIGKRGLFSPGQGLFPRMVCGKYFDNMIITAGCSNTVKIPRVGNPVEVVEIIISKRAGT